MTFRVECIGTDRVLSGEGAPLHLLPERLDAIFDHDPDITERVERILRTGGRTPLVFVAHRGARPVEAASAVDRVSLGSADEPVGFLIASLREGDACIGVIEMFGVATHLRRRGMGRALLRAAESALAALGATGVRVMGNAPVYAWPGVDLRCTAALTFLEGAGYVRTREAIDMGVDLVALADSGAFGAMPARDGDLEVVTLGGTAPEDLVLRERVQVWVAQEFADGWRRELEEALWRGHQGRAAGAVVALRHTTAEPEIVGFAAYGAQRPALFGPMGTAESARGTGIGSRLLLESLAAQHAAGIGWADIGWVGPAGFYERTCGATVSRTYALLSKELAPVGAVAPSRACERE